MPESSGESQASNYWPDEDADAVVRSGKDEGGGGGGKGHLYTTIRSASSIQHASLSVRNMERNESNFPNWNFFKSRGIFFLLSLRIDAERNS